MMIGMNHLTVNLGRGEFTRFDNAKGLRIDCVEGLLWITEDRSRIDVLLQAGQSHQIQSGRQTVIQSLRDSRLCLVAPKASRSHAHPKPSRTWLRWLLSAATGARRWIRAPSFIERTAGSAP